MKRFQALLVLFLLLRGAGMAGQQVQAAPTPPLAWNSWDSYGLTINEAQFRANSTVLHDKLLPFGWNTAVIDEGWYFQNPQARPHPDQLRYELDTNGRFVPVPERFPSGAVSGTASHQDGASTVLGENRGFTEIGRWLHAQGLQFGIHIIRGIPKESVRMNLPIAGSAFHAVDAADVTDTCPWDPTSFGIRDDAAGQAWYDSLLQQYAAWGVDLLKVDCIADHPYRGSEIRQIRRAIQRTGRPMILSLSPGPTALSHMPEVTELAQMWRISNDVWDVWDSTGDFPISVRSQFERLKQWAAYAGPGHWPDADMLPVGSLSPAPEIGPGPRVSRLSQTEQRTLISLWAVARSPLVLGANLTMLSPETLSLLTNRRLLKINQTATGSREVFHSGDVVAWTADMPGKDHAVAVFNLGNTAANVSLNAADLHLVATSPALDIWTGKSLRGKTLRVNLEPHASSVFLLP